MSTPRPTGNTAFVCTGLMTETTARRTQRTNLAVEAEIISKRAQTEIKTALARKQNATVYSYPGQHHAFARHNGAHYNAAAAALANGRTSEFLHQQLR